MQNNVMLKLCSNLSNILFKGGQIMKMWKKGIIFGMVVALAIVCVPEMYVKADEVPTVKASVISSANLIEDQSAVRSVPVTVNPDEKRISFDLP